MPPGYISYCNSITIYPHKKVQLLLILYDTFVWYFRAIRPWKNTLNRSIIWG